MGGCTNCKAKSGCDDRKGEMLASVDLALEQLYPTRTWGEPVDEDANGPAHDELAALAEELATELRAATFVRAGGDDEPCDYIYILALGRTPCVVQVRDHGVPAPAEWLDAEQITEQYLRVVISQRARVAAVQQVSIELVRAGDRFLVREAPRAGVYDAPLLSRMQKLVAILPAYELLHVDFGEIAHAPPGYRAGAWRELFGGEPSIANYLFYPQPDDDDLDDGRGDDTLIDDEVSDALAALVEETGALGAQIVTGDDPPLPADAGRSRLIALGGGEHLRVDLPGGELGRSRCGVRSSRAPAARDPAALGGLAAAGDRVHEGRRHPADRARTGPHHQVLAGARRDRSREQRVRHA